MAARRRIFFDTNVLVYQFDHSAPAKQKRARSLLEDCILEESAVISSQVVQEFMNVSLKKFATKLSADELELVMTELLKPLCDHVPSFDFYERVLKLYSPNSLGFYDAMTVQAALDLGCKTLYSEDLQDGQKFGTLIIKNPFT